MYPLATVPQMSQCEAMIRARDEWGFGYGDYERQCSREADEPRVCGIGLCDQHRRKVTEWRDGCEVLAPSASRTFERWGVEPSAPFVGEHELYTVATD
jgi:hypothetical protein